MGSASKKTTCNGRADGSILKTVARHWTCTTRLADTDHLLVKVPLPLTENVDLVLTSE